MCVLTSLLSPHHIDSFSNWSELSKDLKNLTQITLFNSFISRNEFSNS